MYVNCQLNLNNNKLKMHPSGVPTQKEAFTQEISIPGEKDGTACAVVKLLWVWLFTTTKDYFTTANSALSR